MKKNTLYLQLTILLCIIGTIAFVFSCVVMPGNSLSASLPQLDQTQQDAVLNMKADVWELAEEIGERHFTEPKAYNQAADYISGAFKRNGLVPYEEQFGDKLQYRNIIAEHYGSTMADDVIVVGAHYDTVWLSPGADDNASGVAAMLEIARQIKLKQLKRTVRFIAFANEENPHFLRDSMGSLFHARRAYERNENIKGMISLEMLGFYSEDAGSQSYPKPFSWFYPDKANFIAFVSDFNSRHLLRDSIAVFRSMKLFPSEGLTSPVVLVPDVRRSDQAAFWRYGYSAFMVTDTAGFRNFAYHSVGDVPDSLNYEYMARITTGLVAVIEALANAE